MEKMEDWFTVEKIDESTFAISEYKHWEETHCYLVLGEKQALLIDTGLGVADIKKNVEKLTDLPVLAVTTHVHWDHIGGHKEFTDIGVFHQEQAWLSGSFPIPLSVVKQNLMCRPCAFPETFNPEKYQIYQGGAGRIFKDGDRIELGNRMLQVIHTPGHSPGHVCIYEPEREYLYTGDLVYAGCLFAFYPSTDPKQFFQSVQKVEKLPVKRILPGHHQLDVEPKLVGKIAAGFKQLEDRGKLQQGNGLFEFGEFQIQI